jgi:hypothetical protein
MIKDSDKSSLTTVQNAVATIGNRGAAHQPRGESFNEEKPRIDAVNPARRRRYRLIAATTSRGLLRYEPRRASGRLGLG